MVLVLNILVLSEFHWMEVEGAQLEKRQWSHSPPRGLFGGFLPLCIILGDKKKKMMTHATSATCGQGKLNLQVLSCYCCFFLVSVETEPSATAHEALSYIPSPSLGKYSVTAPHTQPVTTLPGKTSNYPVCEPALSAPLSWVVV